MLFNQRQKFSFIHEFMKGESNINESQLLEATCRMCQLRSKAAHNLLQVPQFQWTKFQISGRNSSDGFEKETYRWRHSIRLWSSNQSITWRRIEKIWTQLCVMEFVIKLIRTNFFIQLRLSLTLQFFLFSRCLCRRCASVLTASYLRSGVYIFAVRFIKYWKVKHVYEAKTDSESFSTEATAARLNLNLPATFHLPASHFTPKRFIISTDFYVFLFAH